MKRRQLILLFEQLEMHAGAGLPLGEAVVAFGARGSKRMQSACMRVAGHVEAGKRLSASLDEEFRVPALATALIETGERSGILIQALASCRRCLEREDELIKRCVSAAAYPAVIGCATIMLMIGLMEGIMPQVIPMLASLHAKLPLLTRMSIGLSDILSAYWWAIAGGIIGVATAAAVLYRKTAWFKNLAHHVLMRSPVLGGLACSYSFTIFFESCGSMLEAGIPVVEAYSRAAETVLLIPLRRKFLIKLQPLIRGEPLHALVSDIRPMPSYASALLRAGESSGKLGPSLLRIAGMIDKDLDHLLKRLTALLEPTMMLGMGGAVGSLALSIMMPIYDISKSLQR